MKVYKIIYVSYIFNFQTITGAMSTLSPPVALENPENQVKVDWIQDCATGPDFDYPPEFYDHTEALWKDKGVQVREYKII